MVPGHLYAEAGQVSISLKSLQQLLIFFYELCTTKSNISIAVAFSNAGVSLSCFFLTTVAETSIAVQRI